MIVKYNVIKVELRSIYFPMM